jgi:hypothetical protein
LAYFGYGTLNAAYRALDRHVCDRVQRFLNRRAKRGGRDARSSPGMMFSGNSACSAQPATDRPRKHMSLA